MRWKIMIEGLDEFSGCGTAEMVIEKPFNRLSEGELGFSVSDGKSIMALLQQLVVKQQCEAYVLTRQYCTDCKTFGASRIMASARSGRSMDVSKSATRGS